MPLYTELMSKYGVSHELRDLVDQKGRHSVSNKNVLLRPTSREQVVGEECLQACGCCHVWAAPALQVQSLTQW